MKSQHKNINEEVERMKSLFTEERLYGNLVEQTLTKREEKENARIAANQQAGLGKTTRLQRKKTKKIKKDAAKAAKVSSKDPNVKGSEASEKVALKACKKGIINMAQNLLSFSMKKRPTVERYKEMVGGAAAYSGITANFNKCKAIPEVANIFNNGMFGEKTVLVALDDIINNGDTEYLTIPGNQRDYQFLGSLGMRGPKGERLSDIISKGLYGDPGQFKVKDINNKTIAKIKDLGNNKYKLMGDKRKYFLKSNLKEVGDVFVVDILKAINKPKKKITVVSGTGKRDKEKESFEFTIS